MLVMSQLHTVGVHAATAPDRYGPLVGDRADTHGVSGYPAAIPVVDLGRAVRTLRLARNRALS